MKRFMIVLAALAMMMSTAAFAEDGAALFKCEVRRLPRRRRPRQDGPLPQGQDRLPMFLMCLPTAARKARTRSPST